MGAGTDLGLTGTKDGCGEGHCGSCTVLLNQRATRSCLLKVRDYANATAGTKSGGFFPQRRERQHQHGVARYDLDTLTGADACSARGWQFRQ